MNTFNMNAEFRHQSVQLTRRQSQVNEREKLKEELVKKGN